MPKDLDSMRDSLRSLLKEQLLLKIIQDTETKRFLPNSKLIERSIRFQNAERLDKYLKEIQITSQVSLGKYNARPLKMV